MQTQVDRNKEQHNYRNTRTNNRTENNNGFKKKKAPQGNNDRQHIMNPRNTMKLKQPIYLKNYNTTKKATSQ